MIDHLYRCQSEAIFGSSARREFDYLSDRDFLVVDDRFSLRHLRRLHLERLGWSVAAYSWRRLKRLVQQKALFAQHLKLEALVVKDDSDRLKHMLSQYSPAADYRVDIDTTGAAIMAAVNGGFPTGTGNWGL